MDGKGSGRPSLLCNALTEPTHRGGQVEEEEEVVEGRQGGAVLQPLLVVVALLLPVRVCI